MSLKRRMLVLVLVVLCLALALLLRFRRGFSATDEPSVFEKAVARRLRNFSIPRSARSQVNPWKATADNLQQARESFMARCAVCHGDDGSGQTPVGRGLYPKPPNLPLPETQQLTDGEIHNIIRNGVRLTGMPAWS